MENERTIVLQFRLSRRGVLALLTLGFLCYNVAVVDSETLSLTTYYPAPYGGYVSLLTTGGTNAAPIDSNLARDAGRVTMGASANVPNNPTVSAMNGARLQVRNGGITGNYGLTPQYAAWNAYSTGDGGAAIYNDGTGFRKLMLVGNSAANPGTGAREVGVWDNLTVNGDITLTGSNNRKIYGLCQRVNYTRGSITSCPANHVVTAHWGNGVTQGYGFLPATFINSTPYQAGTFLAYGQDYSGTMICCRLDVP